MDLPVFGPFLVDGPGNWLFAFPHSHSEAEGLVAVLETAAPSIFLSGFFFPLDAMPPLLRLVSYAMPMRYYLVIVRSLLLKGVGLEVLWREVLALVIFAIVIMGAAALRFKKRLD